MAEVRFGAVTESLGIASVRVRGARHRAPASAVLTGPGWLDALPEPNRFAIRSGGEVLWLGPDEFLVVSATAAGSVIAAKLKAAGAGAAADLSSNWTAYDLVGGQARDVLASGCGLDFHPRAFHVGSVAQTVMAKVGIIIWQRSDEPAYRILVRPSFSNYLGAWVKDAIQGL